LAVVVAATTVVGGFRPGWWPFPAIVTLYSWSCHVGARCLGTDTADTAASPRATYSRLRERSGMAPEPTVQDEAKNSDDSPADGIQGDHAEQQECEHHQRCAALPVAVSPRDRNSGNAD
jgi:hypothetical protein